jgi:hypothetical protein
VLRPASPGLGEHHDRHEGADVRGGQFVVQGEEVRVAALGGEQGAGVVDDRAHYPTADQGSSTAIPLTGSISRISGCVRSAGAGTRCTHCW